MVGQSIDDVIVDNFEAFLVHLCEKEDCQHDIV